MLQYSAAIYANENLLLTELLERIERELPLIEVSVYGDSLAASTMSTSAEEYDVKPAGMISDEDILIILSDPSADMDVLREFEGDIIDFTGTFTDEEIYTVEEPVAYLINAMTKKAEDIEAVAYVPAAVFGRNGIDDMISQTRELFAFSNTESKVFEDRLAFNMFFSDKDQGLLAGYRQKLAADTGVEVDVRMCPVSTGFVLDVYFKKDVNKEFSNITDIVGFVPTLAEAAELKRPVVISRSAGRVSIAGDYLNVITGQITEALKDITGE